MPTFKGKPKQVGGLIGEGVKSFLELADAGHPAHLDIAVALNFGLDRETAMKLAGSVADGALATLVGMPGVEASSSRQSTSDLEAGGGIVVKLNASATGERRGLSETDPTGGAE